MMNLSVRSLIEPVGVVRMLAAILTCLSFGLVASVVIPQEQLSYWTWCMFTWCFCCFFSLLILIFEFTALSSKVPLSWEDFTTAFAVLATLLCLASAIIYPTFFTRDLGHRQIAATVMAWFCFLAYAGEVVLTYLRPRGQTSGFLSSVPGLLKVHECFVACIIFTSIDPGQLSGSPGLRWCVAVYALCFIFDILIILLTVGQACWYFPIPFDILVTVCNVVSALMYLTAMVMWPLYSFQGVPRPSSCGSHCGWDEQVAVTFLSIVNFMVYTADSVLSIQMVFFSQE